MMIMHDDKQTNGDLPLKDNVIDDQEGSGVERVVIMSGKKGRQEWEDINIEMGNAPAKKESTRRTGEWISVITRCTAVVSNLYV